jgi:hypothetical protein
MEFQKNGVINISDYLDSNKHREFNRNNSKILEEQKESLISERNLQLFTENMLMQLNEDENEDHSSSAGPKSGSRS